MESMRADAFFEGGGVKGLGLVGAAAVAEEKGYHWVCLAGVSAGALVAALLAAGYTAVELKQILAELDYNRLKDPGPVARIPVMGPILSLAFNSGIYKGKRLEWWLRDLLRRKNVKTFKDLMVEEIKDYDHQQYRFRLRVVASDVSRGRMLVLPQDIADYGINPEDLDVATAVRMSMSIPFFYEPVRLKHPRMDQVSYIVDGGLFSNFPVWLFDAETAVPEWPTFGFKMVEPEEATPHRVRGPISLLAALFSILMETQDARYIRDKDLVRTIRIPTLGVRTTEFNISPERSETLYQSGRQAAEKFFAGWDFSLAYGKFVSSRKLIEKFERRYGKKLE